MKILSIFAIKTKSGLSDPIFRDLIKNLLLKEVLESSSDGDFDEL